jgi:protein-S-isoprenylcysteine O-methyltransferase
MGTTFAIRIFLLAAGCLFALILSCLGLETCKNNLIGWLLIGIGIGYLFGGAIYLWAYSDNEAVVREETGDRSFWLVLPGFLAIFYGPPLEYLYLPETLPRLQWMEIAGLLLIGVGLLIRIWTRIIAKGLYTGHVKVRVGHRLIQEGPYQFVRHPGYTGYVVMAIGLSIGYSSLIGLFAITALLLPGLLYRMNVEETLLTQQFGDEYRHYIMNTKRLIPGIW